jgi:hypothetical protein
MAVTYDNSSFASICLFADAFFGESGLALIFLDLVDRLLRSFTYLSSTSTYTVRDELSYSPTKIFSFTIDHALQTFLFPQSRIFVTLKNGKGSKETLETSSSSISMDVGQTGRYLCSKTFTRSSQMEGEFASRCKLSLINLMEMLRTSA